jgi:hypothetical protein
VALAQGERRLEPINPSQQAQPIPQGAWYVGSNKPRFTSWFTSNSYVLLNGTVPLNFSYTAPSPARSVRFTPTSGGSILRVDLNDANVRTQPAGPSPFGQMFGVQLVLNASDFGVNGGAQSYRMVLVDAGGNEGEPVQIALNFRSRNDFRLDPSIARAEEVLSSIVPIGYFQAQLGGSVFVPSVQNYQTYSRLWFELRLPPTIYFDPNTARQAVGTGAVELSDDAGQRYTVEWDNQALSGLPEANSLRFALLLTPRLTETARTLILVQKPLKPENVAPGVPFDTLVEPFKSGLRLTLPLQR